MPLSEDHHASKKGKSEFSHSTKMPNYSSDLSSFMPEHELVELLWENGQIVMQGQSNRTKKSSAGTEFAFNGRLEEKFAHELPPTVPMLAQEDDAAPWLNYALDDSIQNDFCSELFSELTGVHTPSLSNTNNNLYPSNKSTGYSQATKDSHILKSSPGASDPSRSLNHFGDLNIARSQKPSQQSSGAGLMNFPYFSRPAALVKANLDGIDRLRSRESTVVQSRNDLLKSFNQPKVDSGSHGKTRVDETELVQNSTVVSRISSSPNCQASSFAASMAAERKEPEKGTEAAVASSSVCSGYDAVAASNDPNHKSKKRAREGDESGEESDDLEEELFVVKKPASSSDRVTAGKRSRAAEVHNLSERRRRDRINEKMKALQELIPNCNKVDKASMLDEAIEYLKSLQLQVQMMSMGNGLFMPPMMLPAGMSFQQLNLRAPQVPHFSPLGMGMGVGFGMGMIDLNGSPGLIPFPPLMAGTQFPCPTVAGVAGLGLHGILPSSTIHSLGIAGQRLPVPVPHAPLFNSQPGLSPQNPLKVSGKDPSCSNNQKQQQNANIKEPKGQASKAFVQNSPTLPMDKAVCQLMQKESKELNGRRVETVNPDAINSKSTRTRIACSAKKNCS